MRKVLVGVLSGVLCFLIGVGVTQLPYMRTARVEVKTASNVERNRLIFKGTVLNIGPPVPGSGVLVWYRFAVYGVEQVTFGHYPYSEILVDHLSLSGDELDGLTAGERVCVSVVKSKELPRYLNPSDARQAGERVNFFYLGVLLDPESSICQ